MKFINKLKHYIFIILVFLAYFSYASANLSISEIMYNGDGADIDWVEVYNGGSADIDLTKVKLLISNSTSNHELNGYSGSQYLHPGDYGVITITSQLELFISKWGNLSPIFTSSFSLPNLKEGESATVSINNGDKNSSIDSVSYYLSQGANDNGNSLQLIDNEWRESNPTPTRENYTSDEIIEENTNTESSTAASSGSSSSVSKKEKLEELKINTKIVAKNVVVAGVEFPIESLTTTNRKTTLMVGRYVWNFGDGTSSQEKTGSSFNHIYYYPGEYVVTLNYYKNLGSFDPSASDRLIIKVIPAGITISSTGDVQDPFIELENKSSYEIDLSNWIILGSNHNFTIPEGTFLLSNKKLKISSKITNFVSEDLIYISIKNPKGEIVDVYPKNKIINKVNYSSGSSNSNNKIKNTQVDSTPKDINSEVINLNDLESSAADANTKNLKFDYPLVGLFVIITLGISSFILIKKSKKEDPLNKEIRAEDMMIIE